MNIDKILEEVSWRTSSGIVDLKNHSHMEILKEVLSELGASSEVSQEVINSLNKEKKDSSMPENPVKKVDKLDTVDAESSSITKKNIAQYVINKLNDKLLSKKILNGLLKDKKSLSKLITYINKNLSIPDACDILSTLDGNKIEKILESPIGDERGGVMSGKEIGRGELSLLIVSKNSKKASVPPGDIIDSGKTWEIKKLKTKSSAIMAGGTRRPEIIKFTSFLWELDDMLSTDQRVGMLNKLFGSIPNSPFNLTDKKFSDEWDKAAEAEKNPETEVKRISFTSIGINKFSGIQKFMENLKIAYEILKNEQTDKIDIRGVTKTFIVDPNDKKKLKDIPTGSSVDVHLIATDGDRDERLLNYIEKLGFTDVITNADYIKNIPEILKNEFISELSGGLIIAETDKYTAYTKDEFMKSFNFSAITQGNRPNFKLKKSE